MTAGDGELRRRVEEIEKEQAAAKKWREGIDALVNKGKGFWLAMILLGSAAAAGLATLWELLKHWRGVAGS